MFVSIVAIFLLVGFFALLGLLFPHAAAPHPLQQPPQFPPLWLFVAMPFLEGIMVFIMTALGCLFYNHTVRFTGGIELNVIGPAQIGMIPQPPQTASSHE